MIRVTRRAMDELKDALDDQSPVANGSLGFRLLLLAPPAAEDEIPASPGAGETTWPPAGTSLGLTLDEPASDDEVVSWQDRPILILAPQIAEVLDGLLMDVIETPDGSREIAIEIPNDPA